MRKLFGTLIILAMATPALAQRAGPPPRPPVRPPLQAPAPPDKPADDKVIVVTGVANGARVVEVDFDKVWKNCAECKRALAKLDRLAQPYRDERHTALQAINRPAPPPGSPATVGVSSFSQSSATDIGSVDEQRRTGLVDVQRSVAGERQGDQTAFYYSELNRRFIRPEAIKLGTYTQSFLDQLAPHIAAATEAERIANNAQAGLTDKKRTKVSAKRLTRIDVTQAVIRRLDAMNFTIDLPEPVLSPARTYTPKAR